MGLFSTVLHIYKRGQADVVAGLSNELREVYALQKTDVHELDLRQVMDGETQAGVSYLITAPHGHWITVIEAGVNLDEPFYLYELTKGLSKRLMTYVLSFHLHDGDVLYYNLEKEGMSLDGYNSDYQYFLEGPAEREEILGQRHASLPFQALLPAAKNVIQLNAILNEGYWRAFDDDALDENGVPAEEYLVDEEERFERVGIYLEIFSPEEYPFAYWYHHLERLDRSGWLMLKGER